jgi:hypothetical protein
MTELLPAMTANETVVLTAFFASARSYVEFGCGGSTFLAAKTIKQRIITVDSDRAWLSKIDAACEASGTALRPEICFTDIGPVSEFGYPTDETQRDHWPRYYRQVWSIPGANTADLYMVDGRFRVACFLQILLQGMADSIILFHDYVSRPHYHAIASFARELCRIDELAAFQRRPDFASEEANALLHWHRFDTR